MVKNYYVILGVPVDATPRTIRSAFRDRAKRYHPDHGETRDAREFRELSEAYEILSDPARRARYDREFGRRATPKPEELIANPVSIVGRPETVRPSVEALFERLMRNFSGLDRPKSEHEEPLDFELILAPDEAARGVVIPFEVPVLVICTACEGSGTDWGVDCRTCDGHGRLVDDRTVEVRIPARVPDGSVIEVSLAELGIENLWLRVHVRIARH